MDVRSAFFAACSTLLIAGTAHAVTYRDGTWDQSLGNVTKGVGGAADYCFLTRVSGKFRGGGEEVRLRRDPKSGAWTLGGRSQQSGVAARATCLPMTTFLSPSWGVVRWISPQFSVTSQVSSSFFRCGSAPLGSYRYNSAWWGDAFTALTGMSGKFAGLGEFVMVDQSKQGKQPSHVGAAVGQCDVPVTGYAMSYFVGKPSSGTVAVFIGPGGTGPVDIAGEYTFTVSKKADAIRMIPTNQGVCFFTRLSGRFNGGGEFASIERETVNGVEYWRLLLQHAGAEGALQAHARCAAFAQP